jgi:Co/Zn/Cd efflux system component
MPAELLVAVAAAPFVAVIVAGLVWMAIDRLSRPW